MTESVPHPNDDNTIQTDDIATAASVTMKKEAYAVTIGRYDRLLAGELALERDDAALNQRQATLTASQLLLYSKTAEWTSEVDRLEKLLLAMKDTCEKRIGEAEAQSAESQAAAVARNNEITDLKRELSELQAKKAEVDIKVQTLEKERSFLAARVGCLEAWNTESQRQASDRHAEMDKLKKQNQTQAETIQTLQHGKR